MSSNPLKQLSGTVGAVIGALVGVYSGVNILVPAIGGLFSGWLANKFVKPDARPMIPAFAIQTGHLLWIALAGVIIGQINVVLLDVVIMSVGLVWLILRPGLWPVVFLSVFQAVVFVLNLLSFFSAQVGSAPHKALLVHLILRAAAIALMYIGLQEIRRPKPSTSAGDVNSDRESTG